MSHYTLFAPDTEQLGQSLIDLVNAIESENWQPFLVKHGLTNLEPDKWYPAQRFLDFLNDIKDRGGEMLDFVSIGMKQAADAKLPPEVEYLPIEQSLMIGEVAYQMHYRGSDIGSIKVQIVEPRHAVVTLRTPFPDDVWYGTYYGMMKRLLPKGTHFTVTYDPAHRRRDQGGETTILHIKW